MDGYIVWQPRGSPGFDGWLQIVKEDFESEDLAASEEKLRLRAIGRFTRRKLEASGVDSSDGCASSVLIVLGDSTESDESGPG